MNARYEASQLRDFASALLTAAGLAPERAACVAEVLLEGDLLGRTTHGLALLAPYLRALDEGTMAAVGEPVVEADHGSALWWDGGLLPGPWLLTRALDEALARLDDHPVVTVSIRRSHHLAALGAYLERATAEGALCLLTATDPRIQTVAPFGGVDAVLTSNPIAAGIPNGDDPILIDISTSLVSNAGLWQYRAQGQPLPGRWLRQGDGTLTDDAAAIDDDPPATILALGGEELGYKGFALGLLVEALALALSGHRRPSPEGGWSEGVFLQLIDPERFAGRRNFSDAIAWLVAACRASRVPEGAPPVRLPGEAARRRRSDQRAHGVTLDPATLDKLAPWAERYAVPAPAARS
ncbi:MAG: Ldh family oxidoreductase [Alphaproteobacteria bacterium]|jgi:L-lactate dehydrogenase|nr:lactate dehydrogenase [Rhodospirillaceae bacterium]MDP6405319.1 Ldh family oxidoreductase [Alphaproteobacteria bacterium]MDP6620670.1 Ldh family oxidoreductase [Alphaproteobacteria bacterium]